MRHPRPVPPALITAAAAPAGATGSTPAPSQPGSSSGRVGDPEITRRAAGGTEPVPGIGGETVGDNTERWVRGSDVAVLLLALEPADATVGPAGTVPART